MVGRAKRALSCFAMTLSYPRALYLEFFFDQTVENFLRGHVHAFQAWSGQPRVILDDNLKSAETVPLSLVESALLLGTRRRLARPDDLPPLPRIRSLAYFLPVIAELQQQPLPAGYLDYLRLKLHKLAKAPRPDLEKTTFSNER
jgi:hypothetical protein